MRLFDRLRVLFGLGCRRLRARLGLGPDRRSGPADRRDEDGSRAEALADAQRVRWMPKADEHPGAKVAEEFHRLAAEASERGEPMLAGIFRVEAGNDRTDWKPVPAPPLGKLRCVDCGARFDPYDPEALHAHRRGAH